MHTRGIYVYQREKPIFLLRVLIKKTQKTPSAELRVALKRQQEMLDEQKDY
ncbi:type II toxin-antitoxin system RelE/ParE family toxin [Enterobacter asburiae]